MEEEEYQLLEINLISAQDLKPPPLTTLKLHSYATISSSSSSSAPKLRTRVDKSNSPNPTWNDKFILRLPTSSLSSPSSSITISILSKSSTWLLPDPLLGSVRLLLSNYRLLDHPKDVPTFVAVGIRRESGRFHGVLNVGFMLLSKISKVMEEKLKVCYAVGYRELMGGSGSLVNSLSSALKVVNREVKGEEGEEEEMKKLCGLGIGMGLGRMQIHSSPSDQNLQIS